MDQFKLGSWFEDGRALRYDRRNVVVHAEDEPNAVYFIDSGFVKVYAIDQAGEEHVYTVLKPGEIFPITWMLRRDDIANEVPIYHETLTPCSLRSIRIQDFRDKINSRPELTTTVYRYALGMISMLMVRLTTMHLRSASGRVTSQLLHMGRYFGVPAEGGVVLPFGSQQLIASSTNLSRETVTREILKLRQQGAVQADAANVGILHLDRLQELLDAER